jgi:transposase-like protein
MGQAARKVTAKDANEKLAHRRLTVLEPAERLGNVAEACRRGGIDRTSFYDWKRQLLENAAQLFAPPESGGDRAAELTEPARSGS